MPRILVEQGFQRMEALDDSLGEVPTLDSQTDDHVGSDPMALPDGRSAGSDVRQNLQPARRPFDRDRISRHPAYPALERHGHLLMIDLTFHEWIHRFEEILAVVAALESQDG